MTDPAPPAGGLTSDLAAGISRRAVGLAFGPTQQVGDLHIVPVAFVGYGFGALDRSTGADSGGGGGGVAIPLGIYVGEQGRLRFRPNTVAVVALLVPIVATIGTAVRAATDRHRQAVGLLGRRHRALNGAQE